MKQPRKTGNLKSTIFLFKAKSVNKRCTQKHLNQFYVVVKECVVGGVRYLSKKYSARNRRLVSGQNPPPFEFGLSLLATRVRGIFQLHFHGQRLIFKFYAPKFWGFFLFIILFTHFAKNQHLSCFRLYEIELSF